MMTNVSQCFTITINFISIAEREKKLIKIYRKSKKKDLLALPE